MTDKARTLLERASAYYDNGGTFPAHWMVDVRAYLAEPVTAPAGLADALAAAQYGEWRPLSELVAEGHAPKGCIVQIEGDAWPCYLYQTFNKKRAAILTWNGARGCPLDREGGESAKMARVLWPPPGWPRTLEAPRVPDDNGAVYSIREGETGAEPHISACCCGECVGATWQPTTVSKLPAAEQPADAPAKIKYSDLLNGNWPGYQQQPFAPGQPADAPSVADIEAEFYRVNARLGELAEQVRTLQQDVAALKQQGGELREGEPLSVGVVKADGESLGSNWQVQVFIKDCPAQLRTSRYAERETAERVAAGIRTALNLPQPAAPGVSI